jgi:hypothetical protein
MWPAFRPIKLPNQWILGVLLVGERPSQNVMLTTHPHIVPRSRMFLPCSFTMHTGSSCLFYFVVNYIVNSFNLYMPLHMWTLLTLFSFYILFFQHFYIFLVSKIEVTVTRVDVSCFNMENLLPIRRAATDCTAIVSNFKHLLEFDQGCFPLSTAQITTLCNDNSPLQQVIGPCDYRLSINHTFNDLHVFNLYSSYNSPPIRKHSTHRAGLSRLALCGKRHVVGTSAGLLLAR